MNLTVACIRSSVSSELQPLRNDYLDTLPEAQELLLEVLVGGADSYLLRTRAGVICGYALVHGKGTLLEFHLVRDHWVFGETILRQVVAELSLKRAMVKSFDSLLLSSALSLQTGLKVLGLLVRDYVPRKLPVLSRIQYKSRIANANDMTRLLAVDQDVFTIRERLEHVVAEGQVRIFEKGESTVGFGILRPVVAGRKDIDVAIAVDKPFRGKGYATYVFRDLVEECLDSGQHPTCGCASDNHASRHLGERIGMIARHRLLELSF